MKLFSAVKQNVTASNVLEVYQVDGGRKHRDKLFFDKKAAEEYASVGGLKLSQVHNKSSYYVDYMTPGLWWDKTNVVLVGDYITDTNNITRSAYTTPRLLGQAKKDLEKHNSGMIAHMDSIPRY